MAGSVIRCAHDERHDARAVRRRSESNRSDSNRSPTTQIIHLALLLVVLHQLIGSEFMEIPLPGDTGMALRFALICRALRRRGHRGLLSLAARNRTVADAQSRVVSGAHSLRLEPRTDARSVRPGRTIGETDARSIRIEARYVRRIRSAERHEAHKRRLAAHPDLACDLSHAHGVSPQGS
jgi:hypothetical protein